MSQHSVRRVHVQEDTGVVTIMFSDGHALLIYPNTGGFKESSSIERIELKRRGKTEFVLHSVYQDPVTRVPLGIVQCDVKRAKVIGYWQAAIKHLSPATMEGRRPHARNETIKSRQDLDDFINGVYVRPS